MLKAYKFVETEHQKLHDFVIDFFNTIESNTKNYEAAGSKISEFYTENFHLEFQPIVKSHYKILKSAFYEIYLELRQLSQADRTIICEQIRLSNNIKHICTGAYTPNAFNSATIGLNGKIRSLFIKLYENILDGNPVRDNLGITLRSHFNEFRSVNSDITLCPMCGISELKTQYDKTRDPYDHYLPKSLYPFSSVNFFNLIPTCTDCNSPAIKGDKDIVILATSGKFFYPYDTNHKGIEISFTIGQDEVEFEDIDWSVGFSNPDHKNDEISSWNIIYNIEERYKGFVKGRIRKWYTSYWNFYNKMTSIPTTQRLEIYLESIGADEEQFLSVIRRPALEEFMKTSAIAQAEQQAIEYQ